jgi:anion-transporting  ArsA/GET3 family ATPase
VSRLARLLEERRIVVLVGEGGVGKTTTSATLALAAARRGRHVACITVDPAPRLGDALGLGPLRPEPRSVPIQGSGSLVALRLDTRHGLDRLVEQLAPDLEVAARLRANRVYRGIADRLGGTQGYMAFARLHELAEAGDFDLILVDTPPTTDVAELLEAPLRLANLLDTGAMEVLAEPGRLLMRAGSGLARAGLTAVLGVLERIAGRALVQQISEFFELAAQMVASLAERSEAVDEMLRSSTTAFVVVTRPHPHSALRAREQVAELQRRAMAVEVVVLNRCLGPIPDDRRIALEERLAGAPAQVSAAVCRMEAMLDGLRHAQREAARVLGEGLPGGAETVEVAALEEDIESREDLERMAEQLGLLQSVSDVECPAAPGPAAEGPGE